MADLPPPDAHSLGGNGFTTRVEFETKTGRVEAEREDEKDPD